MLKAVAKIGNILLRIVSGILASTMFIYSAYAMYDSYYTNKQAFSSWDLAQYKPVAVSEESEETGFEEILEINDSVVSWLTVDDTNIDYPVAHGADDLEYASKDIYGNPSITGAIYLAAQNYGDFSDQYNIIYGHHMDNGAMFGDIDKFEDQGFFDTHKYGYLRTPSKNYILEIFACMKTDAYDNSVYSVIQNRIAPMERILSYIEGKAVRWRDPGSVEKIIALSTCSDFETNGRIVVFAKAYETDEILDEDTPLSLDIRKAIGHGQSRVWALLNLICVFLTLYTWLPLFGLRRKFSRKKKAKNYIEESNELLDFWDESKEEIMKSYTDELKEMFETTFEEIEEIVKDMKKFIRRFNIGLIVEPIIFILAVIAFILTEDIFNPMVLIDKWTPLMIAIFGISIIIDWRLYVYRGIQPDDEDEDDSEDNDEKSENTPEPEGSEA